MLKLVPNLSFPLYCLEPGKPDPNVPWEKGKHRPRIAQSPQKGGTCWYYAANLLRERIGKQFPPEYKKARQIEKQCSLLRKNVASVEISPVEQVIIDSIMENCPSRTEMKKKSFETHNNLIRAVMCNCITLAQSGKLLRLFREFCEQEEFDNFSDFVNDDYHKCAVSVYSQFLKNMGISPGAMLANKAKKGALREHPEIPPQMLDGLFDAEFVNNGPSSSFKSLSLPDQHNIYAAFSNSATFQAYGFRTSTWNPSQPIGVLQQSLIMHGPLIVSGTLGRGYYETEPREIKKIAERCIYGWDKGDKRQNHEEFGVGISHIVLVIGAQKGGKRGGYVFYVDPNDGSDPKNPELQRIYVTSHQTFINCINDICIIPCISQTASQLAAVSTSAYALYRDPLLDYPSFCSSLPLKDSSSSDEGLELSMAELSPQNEVKQLPTSIEACVDFDVGFGNSLGIRVEPNWGESIPFAWTPNGWVGQVPVGKHFKVVKVSSKGIQWEQRAEGNRFIKESSKDRLMLTGKDIRF